MLRSGVRQHGRRGRARHQLPRHRLAGDGVERGGVLDLRGRVRRVGQERQSAGRQRQGSAAQARGTARPARHARTFHTRERSGAQLRCASPSVSNTRSTRSKPTPCGLAGPRGMGCASTSTTCRRVPPSGQSTDMSSRTCQCVSVWVGGGRRGGSGGGKGGGAAAERRAAARAPVSGGLGPCVPPKAPRPPPTARQARAHLEKVLVQHGVDARLHQAAPARLPARQPLLFKQGVGGHNARQLGLKPNGPVLVQRPVEAVPVVEWWEWWGWRGWEG